VLPNHTKLQAKLTDHGIYQLNCQFACKWNLVSKSLDPVFYPHPVTREGRDITAVNWPVFKIPLVIAFSYITSININITSTLIRCQSR